MQANETAVAPRAVPLCGPVSWERMIRAVEKVRERLRRAAAALGTARVPYAVAGGNAVAAWVSRVDEAAVRNTQDVDILLRRADLPRAIEVLSGAGFCHRHAASLAAVSGWSKRSRSRLHPYRIRCREGQARIPGPSAGCHRFRAGRVLSPAEP